MDLEDSVGLENTISSASQAQRKSSRTSSTDMTHLLILWMDKMTSLLSIMRLVNRMESLRSKINSSKIHLLPLEARHSEEQALVVISILDSDRWTQTSGDLEEASTKDSETLGASEEWAAWEDLVASRAAASHRCHQAHSQGDQDHSQ